MNVLNVKCVPAFSYAATALLATTALTSILATASPAGAVDVTISTNTNQTIFLDPLQSGPSTVTVQSGVTVNASPSSQAIVATTAPWTVTNSGTLNASANATGAVTLILGGTVNNTQTGSINNSIGLGVVVFGGANNVQNSGVISSVRSAVAVAEGFGTSTESGTVLNTSTGRLTSQDATGIIYQDLGTINITNAGIVEGGRQGVLMWSGTINNSGEIRSTNTTTFSEAVTVARGTATINNTGKISGSSFYQTGGFAGTGSIGIFVDPTATANITNSATGEITGTIVGVALSGSGSTITNSGKVSSTVSGGAITARGGNNTIFNNVGGVISASATPPPEYANINVAIVMNGANNALTNSGTIQGRVLLGRNGTVTNNTNARIEGNAAIFLSETQPLIDQSQGFSGTLVNAGTITGNAAATTLTNTGTVGGNLFGSTVINAGTVSGNISLTAGADTLTLRTGSNIVGGIDAGEGNDTLILEGSGTAANGFANFENLSMRGSQWTLTGNSMFNSVTVQSGVLNINGNVMGGPIALSAAGAGLSGIGNIGGAVTNTTGTITPGNAGAIGTLSIAGNYTHGATARLIIDANETGAGDRLRVGGQATLQGGTLQVAAVDGTWNTARTYTILEAQGGVSGTFGTLELNLDYLTPQLAYSANAVTLSLQRATAEIQQDIVKETSEQQVSTSVRKTTATVESRIDEVVTAAFPVITPEGEQQSSANYGGITSLSAGDGMGGWGAWATLTPTFVNQDLILPGQIAAQRVKGETWDMFAGVDKLIWDRAVIGGLIGFEASDYELQGNNGDSEAEGPMAALYAGVLLNDWLYASGQINHAWFDNSLTESAFGGAAVSGKFDSKRLTASVSMTARHEINRVKLSGKVGYSYTKETFDSYIASDSTPVNPSRTRLGRVTFGTEAAYRGDTLMPYVLASFERDVEVSGGPGEREGFVFGGGARLMAERYSLDLYGSKESGRQGESATSFGINFRLSF